ncbi:TPA: hypothetical protein DIU22_05440 [Candidatus Woesebacteria bacterium]|nr:hypothetical protein [Candidatus Woesebacteria bacterium]
MKTIIKKAFFDLGPGILHSEAWRKDLWEGYEIIGLEPDPTRYNILKDSYPGILLNLAVSNEIGQIKGIFHSTSGFIVYGYPGYSETVTISAVTLDWLDKEYGPFDEIAIWADIEGSELNMLKGATEVLKKTNWINVELHTGPKTEHWARSYDVYAFLEKLGFVTLTKEKPQTLHDSCYDATFTRDINIKKYEKN